MDKDVQGGRKGRFRWGFKSALLALLGLLLWSEWTLSLMRAVSSREGSAVLQGGLLFVSLLPAMALLVYRFRLVFDFFRSVQVGVTNLMLIGLGAIVGVLFQQEDPDRPLPQGAVESLAAYATGERGDWPREMQRAYGEYQDFRTAEAFFTYHLLNSMPFGLGRSAMGFDDAPGDPEAIRRSLENLATRLPELRDRYGDEFAIAIESQTETGLRTRAKNAEIRVLEERWDDAWFTLFVWSDRLDLRRAYRSDWYGVLWAVLFLGVLSNTFRGGWRRLLKWQKWGFVVTHAGVMLLILGAFHGRMTERRGILELRIGESSNRFVLFKPTLDGRRTMEFREPSLLFEDGELFTVGLSDFRADHHDVIDVIYAVSDENGQLVEKEFDLRDPKLRVFEGKTANYDWGVLDGERRPWLRLVVAEHAHQSEHEFQLRAAAPGEDGMPLARVALFGEGGVQEGGRVLADLGTGEDLVFHDPHTGTKVRLVTVADRAEAARMLAEGDADGNWGQLRLPPRTVAEQPQVLEIAPGTRGSFRRDDREYQVEVLRVMPDFRLEMELQAGHIDRIPEAWAVPVAIPAAELRIRSGDQEEVRWVLEHEFTREDLTFPELKLAFEWDYWDSPALRRVELFAAGDEVLMGLSGEPDSLHPVEQGEELSLDESHRLVITEAYAHGTAEDGYREVTHGDFFDASPPSIRLRVEMLDGPADGAVEERVEEFVLYAGFSEAGQGRRLSYVGPDGGRRELLLRFREDRDPGELPVEWQSRLLILHEKPGGGTEELASGDIRVNDYFHFEGFRFFQTNHDPADPTYSGIGVVYDPGIETVLLGLYMVMFGTGWVFLIQPLLTRKHRGTD